MVYAWANNAPSLDLPEGVGFKVGGPDSGIDWLVLQVHYATTQFIDQDIGDDSGVAIHYTNVPMPRCLVHICFQVLEEKYSGTQPICSCRREARI